MWFCFFPLLSFPSHRNTILWIPLLKNNCLILFCGMNTLWNTVAPMQSTLCSEWKTWKQDVMKWFSAPPSLSSSKDTQQQSYDDLYQANLQVCRKGPNLKFMVQIHMLHKWKSRTKL
ncbi:hypothetical protein GLYMA_13G087350v4 [Glycine max]|nr:hypothetical protein GLYMA_13G087350v4 [Glycine max]KAH1100480.1 hypothetical protein GYH30_035574 [Glycine max]